ncbi:MAG: hypothetical protein MSC31_15530 [Solirubrobacteraceae bacterium MAG38_C4-C5]|nr:hypothetical protein [Candidatus Siliceabacter maunaloa]
MSDAERKDDADGCLGWVGVAIVLALVVAALISVAALVDPFSWMPPVGEIWADCDDDYATERDECALENRFPGFWIHALVNLVYAAVALGLVLAFLASVFDLRVKRAARFASAVAAAEHRSAMDQAIGCGVALAAVALLPIVVAIA